MKIFQYIMLIALMIFNIPLFAMNALRKKQIAIAEKRANNLLKRSIRKKEAKLGKGAGIKIFGSNEKPIDLQLECYTNNECYPTTKALTDLLNTYTPFKEYMPGMPKVIVEKSTEAGNRTGALFVAYRYNNQETERRPLFFLKISSQSSSSVPETLDKLQKGPVGRFGLKAISNPDLPIIVLQEMFFICRGRNNKNYTIEVMHLAHGEKIVKILNDGDLASIKHCAERYGLALGLFHVEFMQYNNSDDPAKWTTMAHGDLHLNNVFFDPKNSRVYFIDNGEMAESKLLPFLDLPFIYPRSKEVLKSYSNQRIAQSGASRLKRKKASGAEISEEQIKEKENEAKKAQQEGDRNANFVIHCLKAYVSAYPSDKRKQIGDYLKNSLIPLLNEDLEYAQRNSEPHLQDIQTFIAQIDAALKQENINPSNNTQMLM